MALYFENLSGQPVWVAFAFFDPNSCGPANQNFRKQGWWQLDRNPRNPAGFETSILRFNAWNVDLRTVNRYAYFYAETANDGSSWSGTGNSWLSVNPAAGFSQCAFENADDPQWVDFYGLDFSSTPAGYDTVVQLFDWAAATLSQFPGLPRVQVNAERRDPDTDIIDIIGLPEPG